MDSTIQIEQNQKQLNNVQKMFEEKHREKQLIEMDIDDQTKYQDQETDKVREINQALKAKVNALREDVKALGDEVNTLQKKKKQIDVSLEEAKESIKYSNVEHNTIKEQQLKNNQKINELDKERSKLEAEIYSLRKPKPTQIKQKDMVQEKLQNAKNVDVDKSSNGSETPSKKAKTTITAYQEY